ncbi:hypothetical protein NPIL_309271 [Nephila pilipes]|uniref:Uncharacterized protein n=1 Tax=Nephila pilipes TaxID=299642 RepID=A0A8X6NX91_NEPPI|nr:hypothetical protein NPIL_309271 [Nephila pilipes]
MKPSSFESNGSELTRFPRSVYRASQTFNEISVSTNFRILNTNAVVACKMKRKSSDLLQSVIIDVSGSIFPFMRCKMVFFDMLSTTGKTLIRAHFTFPMFLLPQLHVHSEKHPNRDLTRSPGNTNRKGKSAILCG